MNELQSGTRLNGGKYIVVRKLGSGTFGITYLAQASVTVGGNLNSFVATTNVAIKEFFMSELSSRSQSGNNVEGTSSTIVTNYRRKFRVEAENLARLHNQSIVKVFDIWDENGTTYYAMDYIDGISLDDYIKQQGAIAENTALLMFHDIGKAVAYMHSQKMIHLDIKPKNIMLPRNGTPVLIDFGLSKQYDTNGNPESSTSVGAGTPGYAPIEQAYNHEGKDFPTTMDVYALGATLYKMLSAQTPPDASAILNNGFPEQVLQSKGVSQKTIATIKRAMSPSKNGRQQSVTELLLSLSIPQQSSYQHTETTTEEIEATVADVFEPQPSPRKPRQNRVTSVQEPPENSKLTKGNKAVLWFWTIAWLIGAIIFTIMAGSYFHFLEFIILLVLLLMTIFTGRMLKGVNLLHTSLLISSISLALAVYGFSDRTGFLGLFTIMIPIYLAYYLSFRLPSKGKSIYSKLRKENKLLKILGIVTSCIVIFVYLVFFIDYFA